MVYYGFFDLRPSTLAEAIYRLYGCGTPKEIQFFKRLKGLHLDNDGYLVDSDGIRYKRREPLATIDIVFGNGITSTEVNRIREQILNINPQPHGFLRIKHPDSEKVREQTRKLLEPYTKLPPSDPQALSKARLEEILNRIDYAEEWRVLEHDIHPAGLLFTEAELKKIHGKNWTEKSDEKIDMGPRELKVEIYRVEFYHLGE